MKNLLFLSLLMTLPCGLNAQANKDTNMISHPVESIIDVEQLRGIAARDQAKLTAEQRTALDNFTKAVGEASLNQSKGLDNLLKAKTCTTVYWGCGSCNGGVRTDYYCGNADRSETADYSTCTPCTE